MYYINDEEVGEAVANQYYKDWISNTENFEITKTLKDLINVHCNQEANDIATKDIQNDY